MQNVNLTMEDWFDILGGISLVFFFTSTLLFSRISVRYIEREMEKTGRQSPEWDKGIGVRVTMYAMAITRNRVNKVTLFDEQAVIDHARKIDWYLAVFIQVSLAMLMIVGGIGYLLYG